MVEAPPARVGPVATRTPDWRAGRVAIIVGNELRDPTRHEIEAGLRARIDVFELQSGYHARLFDFAYLHNAQGMIRSRLLPKLAVRTRQWSLLLAGAAARSLEDIDVVYATGEDVALPLAAALRASRIDRPRIVMRLEQPYMGRDPVRRLAFDAFADIALQRIDRILCRTTAHLHYLHSVRQIPIEKLLFVPETTDTNFFDPASPPEPDLRPAPSADPYIVSAGLEMRDYPTLIEAVRGLPVQLIIAAGSPWSHYRFDPRSYRSLPANVRIDSFSPVAMRELYRGASMVVVPVLPTLRACGLNVVHEARAMEKPVIVTRTAGMLDFIDDGQDGLFTSPFDVECLRTQIMRLLHAPELAARLGQNGRVRTERMYTLDHYLATVRDTIAAVATRSAGGTTPSQSRT